MSRRLIVPGVALCLLVLGAGQLAAQMPASALGKSRVDPNIPAGTLTVRVLKGSLSDPLPGLDVVLVEQDDSKKPAERLSRTDPAGRATFKGLAPGSKWVKNRRRNPGNMKALSRSLGRIKSAKRMTKALSAVSIRKSCPS